MQYQPHKDWFFQLSSLCLVFAEKKQSLLRVLKHFLFLCELLLKVSFILNCYPTYNGQHKKLNGQKVDGSFLKELCWVLLFKLIQVDVFFISKKFTSWKFWHSIMSTSRKRNLLEKNEKKCCFVSPLYLSSRAYNMQNYVLYNIVYILNRGVLERGEK